MVRTSSKLGELWLWSSIWPWRSRSIAPQNNRDLNQGLLHLWSKFGDPSLNGSRVIARTSKWLTHIQTDTHTHTQTQATTIPEGQNWPRVIKMHSLMGVRRIKVFGFDKSTKWRNTSKLHSPWAMSQRQAQTSRRHVSCSHWWPFFIEEILTFSYQCNFNTGFIYFSFIYLWTHIRYIWC